MRTAFVLMVVFGSACGSDVPKFDRLFPNPTPECVEGTVADDAETQDAGTMARCPAGQRCLGGRCFLPCEGNAQCASSQVCEDGVCVSGSRPDTGPPVDAGMEDAPVDPCDMLVCDTDMAPRCHPSGVCVACVEQADCTIGVPICDLAYGTCATFAPMLACAPCNTDFECDDGRTCAESGDERVCLAPCVAGACPQGFSCNADDACEPRLGTCTGLRNAVQNTACMLDTDCVPLGVTPQPDTCRGEDVALMVPGACVHLCGTTDQCPTGFSCDGTTCIRL